MLRNLVRTVCIPGPLELILLTFGTSLHSADHPHGQAPGEHPLQGFTDTWLGKGVQKRKGDAASIGKLWRKVQELMQHVPQQGSEEHLEVLKNWFDTAEEQFKPTRWKKSAVWH